MIVQNILRYWTTDDADVLDTFLATARERYAALEDALTPISEAVEDLERDWAIRSVEYWMEMTQQFVVLRDVTKRCKHLFEQERSSEATPVALVVSASAPTPCTPCWRWLDTLVLCSPPTASCVSRWSASTCDSDRRCFMRCAT